MATQAESASEGTDPQVRIFLGDCLEVLRSLPNNTVDLVFADPPYNIGKRFGESLDAWPSDDEYFDWCVLWLELCLAKLKQNGSLYVMASTQTMPRFDLWLRDRLSIMSRIVWHYDSSGKQARRYFGSLYEPILFCVRNPAAYTFNASEVAVEARTGSVRGLIDYRGAEPKPYNLEKVPGNVWYFPRVRYRMPEYEEHPSQKPEALLERIVRASSNPGDLVLDPFAGTFTSCAVAQRLGRRAIGIEKETKYYEIGLRRLGLANEHEGRKLAAPQKSYVRLNGLRQKDEARRPEPGLFDD